MAGMTSPGQPDSSHLPSLDADLALRTDYRERMADPTTQKTDPPLAADEVTMLRAFLDFYRATVRRQAEGLTPEQLATPLAPAIMTLGGMLKHLALVEESWFLRYLEGQELSEPWAGVDWDTDPDWEWHSAAADPPEELFALYDRAIAVANDCTDRALAKAGLDTPSVRPSRREGVPFTLRWILVHLIEGVCAARRPRRSHPREHRRPGRPVASHWAIGSETSRSDPLGAAPPPADGFLPAREGAIRECGANLTLTGDDHLHGRQALRVRDEGTAANWHIWIGGGYEANRHFKTPRSVHPRDSGGRHADQPGELDRLDTRSRWRR